MKNNAHLLAATGQSSGAGLDLVRRQVEACERCPRLRAHCCGVAETKRRAYLNWTYWGKPVAGFGDPDARLWIVGLAPGAHGANRTGRVFTGDRSGDFLFAALHRAGFANQPHSTARDDGLQLADCYISAAVRCAPPGNKPLPDEESNCTEYLDAEWDLLKRKRVILALGRIAWDAARRLASRKQSSPPAQSRASFAHGAEDRLSDTLVLVGSYHVSQQNTFTGKLTSRMFDEILKRCAVLMELDRGR